MSKHHEHLMWDVSPAALDWIAKAIEQTAISDPSNAETAQEVHNFINECRARVQHAAAGEPDISETVPGRSADEDWLS